MRPVHILANFEKGFSLGALVSSRCPPASFGLGCDFRHYVLFLVTSEKLIRASVVYPVRSACGKVDLLPFWMVLKYLGFLCLGVPPWSLWFLRQGVLPATLGWLLHRLVVGFPFIRSFQLGAPGGFSL